MAEQVKGKVATLLEMLDTGNEYTIQELVEKSEASIGTVKMQLNYLLPKAGKTVVKIEGEPIKYKLQK